MSLFNDQKFINELIRIAQTSTPAGVVPIPAPAALNPNQDAPAEANQIKAIALKLLTNLQQNQNVPAGFTAEKEGAELSTKHLANLPALLNFLENNGITSPDGHKLVLKHAAQALSSGVSGDAEYAQLEKNVQDQYVKYPATSAVGNPFQYYVHRPGLLEYMQTLQAQAAGTTPDARVLRPYVSPGSPLLTEINQQLKIEIADHSDPNAGKIDKEQPNQADGQKGPLLSVKLDGAEGQQGLLQTLGPISNRYPFLPDRIDFQWIDQWLDSYSAIMHSFTGNTAKDVQTGKGTQGLQVSILAKQYVSSILQDFQTAEQSLSDNAVDIYQTLKALAVSQGKEENIARAYPLAYLQRVMQLILYVQNVLLLFKSTFGTNMPADWVGKAALEQQVDGSESSLAAINKRKVQQWINDLPQAQKQIEGK